MILLRRPIRCRRSVFIYTVGICQTSLLYLQETGSLHALAAHTSHQEHLASYLFFSVTSGSGELNYNGKTYALHSGDCVFIDCRKPYSHATSADLWTLQWCHFFGHTMPEYLQKVSGARRTAGFSSQGNGRIGRSYDRPVFCGRIGQLCAGYENQ
mgnify:CR=1 FL=1